MHLASCNCIHLTAFIQPHASEVDNDSCPVTKQKGDSAEFLLLWPHWAKIYNQKAGAGSLGVVDSADEALHSHPAYGACAAHKVCSMLLAYAPVAARRQHSHRLMLQAHHTLGDKGAGCHLAEGVVQ